ncbi:MAG TPA: YbhB/YbcL family Raf kinase inhibitor-like protein [Candidatus Acidoferrales bacterium]
MKKEMVRSIMVRSIVVLAVALAAGLSAAAQQAAPPAPPPPGPTLVISSPSFSDGARIPTQYTCSATTPPPGGPRNISTGVSPALRWMNPPKGTMAFVLILHDPDAHVPKATTDITHWIVFNIPADTVQLQEAVPPDAPLSSGALQGTNITGKAGYQGPCAGPPNPHHYTFELSALDQKLDLPQGATRDQIQKAMEGHVLGNAVYIGLFNR